MFVNLINKTLAMASLLSYIYIYNSLYEIAIYAFVITVNFLNLTIIASITLNVSLNKL